MVESDGWRTGPVVDGHLLQNQQMAQGDKGQGPGLPKVMAMSELDINDYSDGVVDARGAEE